MASNEKRVLLVMLLTGGFALVEVVDGLRVNSLALLADAAHVATDTAALGLLCFMASRQPCV